MNNMEIVLLFGIFLVLSTELCLKLNVKYEQYKQAIRERKRRAFERIERRRRNEVLLRERVNRVNEQL